MRLVLTTAFMLASNAAFGSSITTISGVPDSSVSIVERRCVDCTAIQPKADETTYKVPVLAHGTQKTEIIDIDGEKKLVRTEAWFGGSPVIHISKLPEWMATNSAIASLHPTADSSTEAEIATLQSSRDGVDLDATTSAVAMKGKAEPADSVTEPTMIALDKFELRLQATR